MTAAVVGGQALVPSTGEAAPAADCSGDGTIITCIITTSYPPPPLLTSPGPAATAAQVQSLRNLEQQAVSNTISDHGLSASNADAVRTWGRDDALTELWGLLVKAIQTAPASRTTDQQNAVDWLAALVRAQGVQAANAAGMEYAKWAGLSQTQYESLLANHASQSALQTFLSGSVLNYNAAPSQATGGYCVYRSPAPFGSEYTGFNDQTCFTPCTSLLGCLPPTPSYDQFVKWGEASAHAKVVNTAGFAQASRSIAVGAGFGAAVVGAGVAGVALSAGLSTVLVGSALQAAIFPFLGIPLSTTVVPGALSATATAELAGSVTAGAVGFIAAVVIVAVTAAVLEGIAVFDAAALPGKLAGLVAGAPGSTPDLNAMLGDPGQAQGLYALFVAATLPAPLLKTCDNSLNPVPIIISGDSGGTSSSPAPCLNPTPIPAATGDDALFAIQPKGGTGTTYATSLTWKDATAQTTATGRISGHWFIEQVTDSHGTGATVQTLRLRYTDWDGKEQTAWLLGNGTDGYKFLGVKDLSSADSALDPSTCVAAGKCFSSATIHYVGTDGNNYSAGVVAHTPPTVAPASSANPVEGSAETFDANGTSPLGLPLTYQWRFENPPPPVIPGEIQIIVICLDSPDGTCYGDPVSGAKVSHTWTVGGTFHVLLTATDSLGKSTMRTFTVTVLALTTLTWPAPAAITYGTPLSATQLNATATSHGTAVPGTLTYKVDDSAVTVADNKVLPAGPHTLTATFTPTDTTTYSTPAPMSYTLTVNPAPLAITANDKTMTYGSSVPAFDAVSNGFVNNDASSVVSGLTCGAVDGSSQPVSSTTPAGHYSITCANASAANYKISYVPGILTINQAATSTTLATSPASTVFGQPATLTASIAVQSPGSGHPSGTVEFKDGETDLGGCAAQPVGTTAQTAICTTSALSVGTHSLTASYSGDPNFLTSSTAAAATQTVTKAATTITLAPTTPVTQGQPVTFTAVVAVTAPGAGTPTGTVTFSDAGRSLGTGQLSVAGGQVQATFSTSILGVGAHPIRAGYGGDGSFQTSASVALTQYVNTNLSSYPKLASGAYNLSNANLSGGYFVGLSLVGASLSGANLTDAVFTGADLTGANLSNSNFMSGAIFTNVTLANANLSNSNLKGANFSGASLSGANLTNSNLMGATGLSTATLTGVVWSKTACPDGTLSDKDGGTCVGHF